MQTSRLFSAVTYIFMLTGVYEVTSRSSMEPSMATMGTPKLVTFKKHFGR